MNILRIRLFTKFYYFNIKSHLNLFLIFFQVRFKFWHLIGFRLRLVLFLKIKIKFGGYNLQVLRFKSSRNCILYFVTALQLMDIIFLVICQHMSFPGIQSDKTIADKLMYIPKINTHITPSVDYKY